MGILGNVESVILLDVQQGVSEYGFDANSLHYFEKMSRDPSFRTQQVSIQDALVEYVEALRAWTRWSQPNGRWDCDPPATAPKIKGDTT